MALSASKLVWPAIFEIRSTTDPIWPTASASCPSVFIETSASRAAWFARSRLPALWLPISPIDFDSSSVAAAVVSTLSVVVIEACAADFIRSKISSAARRIAPDPTLRDRETSFTPATTSLMVSSKAAIAESST